MEEPSLKSLFSVPVLAEFEEANTAIITYGKYNGVSYDCIEDIWSLVNRLDVDIKEAKFSQPTIWKKEHKEIVSMSFQQWRPRLVEQGLLSSKRAEVIAQSLAQDYMDDRVISGGLRTLQIAISPCEEKS